MNTHVMVKGNKIKVRTYNGNRVLNIRDIDKLMGFTKNETSKKVYAATKKAKVSKLVLGTDYAFIPSELASEYKNDGDDYSFPKGCFLLTGSGYMKLFDKKADETILSSYYGIKTKQPEIKDKKPVKDVEETKTDERIVNQATDSLVSNGLIQEFINNCNKVMDIQMQFIENERKANEELRGIIKDMVSVISTSVNNNEAINKINIALSDALDDDFKAWKKKMSEAANKVLSKHSKYKSTNDVFHEAYKLLRKDYGVVWEQEQKEYYEQYGYSAPSTLSLQYWIETTKPEYKNLLIGKLNTLYGERS